MCDDSKNKFSMISKMKFGKSSCTHTLFLPEVNDSSLKNVYISDINKKKLYKSK